MSLISLPSETLSQIAAHLGTSSRHSLSQTHSTLAQLLHSTSPHWRDILHHRHHVTSSTPHYTTQVRDLVHDHYLYATPTVTSLLPPSGNSAHVRVASLLYAASGPIVKVYTLDGTFIRTYTHPSSVKCLHIDGHTILVGLTNHTCYVHTPAKSHPVIRGHRAAVTAVTILDGLVVTGSADRTIRLRNLDSRRHHSVLRGHASTVSFVASTPNNELLSVGDDRIKLWDVAKGVCVSTGRPGKIKHTAISANGSIYACTKRAIYLLDSRMGMNQTAAILSLPRKWGNEEIDCMMLRKDGMVVAGVGGGVAVWEARGGWEGRGLGWVKRGGGSGVWVGERVCLRGGREMLLWGLDGKYEGVVGGVKSSVDMWGLDKGIVVAEGDGRVVMVGGEVGKEEMEIGRGVLRGEGRRRFWTEGSFMDDDWYPVR